MSEAPHETVVLPKRVTLSFVAMVLAFTVALAALGYFINENRKLARQGTQAHDAICTLKADLRQRILDSQKFLDEHKEGVAGIPASVIKNSIRGQRATLKALKLPCPTDPLSPERSHP